MNCIQCAKAVEIFIGAGNLLVFEDFLFGACKINKATLIIGDVFGADSAQFVPILAFGAEENVGAETGVSHELDSHPSLVSLRPGGDDDLLLSLCLWICGDESRRWFEVPAR